MGFLRTQTKPLSVQAVFDIRAHSVGVALVAVHETAPLEVVWQKRLPVRFNQHYDEQHFQRAMRQTLERLQSDIQTEGHLNLRAVHDKRQIDSVRCIFSRPWNISHMTSGKISEPEPFLVTRDHIQSVGRMAYKNFPDLSEDNLVPLQHRIVGIYGDGKSIHSPDDNPVRELTMRMHVSKLPKSVKDMVHKVISQRFHPNKLSFHSSTDVTSRVLSRAFRYPKDFLVFVPEYTQTDILHVQNGQLQQLTTMPIGEDFLVRTISDALGRPLSDIQSRLSLYHRGRHHSDSASDIDVAIEHIGKRWNELANQAMGEIEENSAPRHSYLLISDSKHADVFRGFFLETMQQLPKMQTHIIDEDLFAHHFMRNRKVDSNLALGILGTEVY